MRCRENACRPARCQPSGPPGYAPGPAATRRGIGVERYVASRCLAAARKEENGAARCGSTSAPGATCGRAALACLSASGDRHVAALKESTGCGLDN